MQFSKCLAASALALATSVIPAFAQGNRGSEIIPGLGARKGQVLGAGGNTLDLAIAMLETTNMGTDYAYGTIHSSILL
jgi:hypothetical protein